MFHTSWLHTIYGLQIAAIPLQKRKWNLLGGQKMVSMALKEQHRGGHAPQKVNMAEAKIRNLWHLQVEPLVSCYNYYRDGVKGRSAHWTTLYKTWDYAGHADSSHFHHNYVNVNIKTDHHQFPVLWKQFRFRFPWPIKWKWLGGPTIHLYRKSVRCKWGCLSCLQSLWGSVLCQVHRRILWYSIHRAT